MCIYVYAVYTFKHVYIYIYIYIYAKNGFTYVIAALICNDIYIYVKLTI